MIKMFKPQVVTCENCGYQAHIITEDIPKDNLSVYRGMSCKQTYIDAKVRCPKCKYMFELMFEEKYSSRGETVFECVNDSKNRGLEMSRMMDNGTPLPPVFRPVAASRTAFEKQLDSEGQNIADKIYRWGKESEGCKTVEEFLGDVEDYTKGMTWKKFKKHHFVLSLCAHDGAQIHYMGFNGKFGNVKLKNKLLIDSFMLYLGGEVEDLSRQFCCNKIGRCAEMHAANSCLNRDQALSIDDLRFSVAYICRTAMPRSYCLNCVTLFQTVRNG